MAVAEGVVVAVAEPTGGYRGFDDLDDQARGRRKRLGTAR